MSESVIEIENLSKQYRLGIVGTGTLSNDLNRWWTTQILHKEDPYLKIGEVNDRSTKGNSEFVWALRNINLQINEGEVVGIIGKNGAGKSTLLKILSKVTKPTIGEVRYKGRIASLLEVGTGFHPEMTGRENVYMNGAIMGMTRAEIRKKFDEIVSFAGVERYIDTPVKRYSSGMTVRLGFAIAAHLEPDILVVDEVLAVGDAEFQKKAIGKMQDVSRGEGRTVLFVSHNMAAVSKLCQRCVLLSDGQVKEIGETAAIIKRYLSDGSQRNDHKDVSNYYRDKSSYGQRLRIIDAQCKQQYYWKQKPQITFEVEKIDPLINEIEFGVGFNDAMNNRICTYESRKSFIFDENKSKMKISFQLEAPSFIPGHYIINIGVRSGTYTLDHIPQVLSFNIIDVDENGNHFGFSLGFSESGSIDTAVKYL